MATEILLIAIADVGLDAIKSEIGGLREALKKAQTNGDIKLRDNSYTDYDSLDAALRDPTDGRSITMLHYAGHSNQEGFLVHDGKTLGLEALRSLIETHGKFRFIFLNSCFSEDLAKQFHEIGVPYVIGTEGKVGDKDSAIMASKFYEILGSSPITIENAYGKTLTYFSEHPNELQTNGTFRGALDTGIDEAKNVWKLVFDQAKLSEDQKNWTLIPKYNLVLSDKSNINKLKIFCLYDEAIKADFKDFKSSFITRSDESQQLRIVQGVYEFTNDRPLSKIDVDANTNDLFSKDFMKEYNAADVILHLTTETYPNTILTNSLNILFGKQTKRHIFLPFSGVVKIFDASEKWFEELRVISPGHMKNKLGSTIDSIWQSLNKISSISKLEVFEVFFKEDFEVKLTNVRNPKVVKELIKNIPFYRISTDFSDSSSTKLFFIDIEATDKCCEALLISKIKEYQEIKPYNSTELINCSKQFLGEGDLFKLIYEGLGLKKSETDYADKSIEVIRRRLMGDNDDSKAFDVVLIFYSVTDENVYNEIKVFFEKIETRLQKYKYETIEKSFYCFIIKPIEENNYSVNDAIQKNQYNTSSRFIPLRPIPKFGEDDLKNWQSVRKIDDLNDKLKRVVENKNKLFRKDLIDKMLEYTDCIYMLDEIVKEKLLSLK